MSGSSFDQSLPDTTTLSDATLHVPCFPDFQFKTIGQTPDLLKRMSLANPESQIYQDSDSERVSLSPEPDLANELFTPESSDNTPDIPRHPSLRERLAIADDGVLRATSTGVDASEAWPSKNYSWKPSQTNNVTLASSDRSTPAQEDSAFREARKTSAPSNSGNNVPLASSTSQQSLRPSLGSGDDTKPQNADVPQHRNLTDSFRRSPEEMPHNVLHFTDISTSVIPTQPPELPAFAILQALQIRLAASLANLSPINTQNVVLLAHSLKDQCTEVHTSASHAYSLARKALTAAEESMSAAKECIAVAKTTQTRTDEVMTAVEQLGNGGQELLRNDAVKTLTAGLHELDEWSRQLKSQYRLEQEEKEKKRQIQQVAAQRQDDGSNMQRMPSGVATTENDHLSSLASTSANIPEPLHISVVHEANAIARAWNQICEHSAERRKIAEEELKKHREHEERLEREQHQAHSALAAARAERIAAEEKEKARQEKEAQDAELQRQELEQKREETFGNRKASEERALKIAQEKYKALRLEREATIRLAQQEQQRHKETLEREALQRRLAAEKAQALETQRQQQLHEQELKRQEIAAQKQRVAAEAAKKIQSIRAKLKQTRAPVENTTPPIRNASLPITSSSNYEPLLQMKSPAQHDDSGLGSADDSLAENHDDPWHTMEKTAPNGADGGSLLNRIAASATSSNRPLTSSSGFPISDHQSSSPAATFPVAVDPPVVDAINSLPRTIPTRSELSSHYLENVSLALGRNRNTSGINRQTHKDKSLPSNTHSPPLLPTRAGLPKKPIQSNGQDHRTIISVPTSQPSSISPTAQKTNLPPSTDANAVPKSPKVKIELVDDGPLLKVERVSVAPVFVVPSQSSHRSKTSQDKRKAESPTGIPLLSLPSPPGRATPFKEVLSSIEQTKVSEEGISRPKSANVQKPIPSCISKAAYPGHPVSNLAEQAMASTQTVTTLQFDPVFNLEAPRPNPSLMTTLPQMPPSSLMESMDQFYDYETTSRMGPDTVMANAWTAPSASQEYNQDLMTDQRQGRARSPARPTRRSDHCSPPLAGAVNNQIQQQRTRFPRRGDSSPHRRVSSPLPAYNGYISPIRLRSPDSSGSNSRAATPVGSIPSRQGVPLKRKRLYLNDQGGCPPQRRPRYENQFPYGVVTRNPHLGAEYSATPMRNDSQADWSHVANYSRSPTPEAPRPPPLHLRLDEGNRRPQSSSYRPHQERNNNNNHTDPPFYSLQPPMQGSSYHDDHFKYQTGDHMPRQNARNPTSDSRLPLLDRFTGPTPYSTPNNHNNHHVQHTVPGRMSRPRGRGGGNQASGPRITKGHLIDRLGNP